MKRFLTNLILIISIISILVIPSFAATISDSGEIVILKQPVDTIVTVNASGVSAVYLSVVALGSDLSYQWQWSEDLVTWRNSGSVSATRPIFTGGLNSKDKDTYYRCRISSLSETIYTRIVLVEREPTNIFNFIGSCLRYITSYISLVINSLVTPGAPLYALLPVLCIGIAVAVLLIVIKITKGFSWGM